MSLRSQVTYAITEKVLELDGVMKELDRIAEQWYGTTTNGIQPGK